MRRLLLLSLSCALLVLSFMSRATAAEPVAPDLRIKTLFETNKIPFTVDDQGVFALKLPTYEGRSQTVFVDSATIPYGPFNIRRVWSVAMSLPQGFADPTNEKVPKGMEDDLLSMNGQLMAGSWCITGRNNAIMAIFTLRIPAETDVATLDFSMACAKKVADEVEKKWTGKDAH